MAYIKSLERSALPQRGAFFRFVIGSAESSIATPRQLRRLFGLSGLPGRVPAMIKAHWAMWVVMALFAVGAGMISAGNADILSDVKVMKVLGQINIAHDGA